MTATAMQQVLDESKCMKHRVWAKQDAYNLSKPRCFVLREIDGELRPASASLDFYLGLPPFDSYSRLGTLGPTKKNATTPETLAPLWHEIERASQAAQQEALVALRRSVRALVNYD